MRKILITFFLISGLTLCRDIEIPKDIYIILMYQRHDLTQVDYEEIGILKVNENGNIVIHKPNFNEKNESGMIILEEYLDLVNVDFKKCKLEQIENLEKEPRFPLLIKNIKNYNENYYNVLAIASKELYEKRRGTLLIKNYIKFMQDKREYVCPEYYNGE